MFWTTYMHFLSSGQKPSGSVSASPLPPAARAPADLVAR